MKTGSFYMRKHKEGEMLEWLKRHAWKACIRLKRIGGSNPPLSALTETKRERERKLTIIITNYQILKI